MFYDLFDDFDLIVASLREQYGLGVSSIEFKTMKWKEFKALISGISPDTALGRVVEIRAENDKDRLKHFSKDQLKIRYDWRNKRAGKRDEDEVKAFYMSMLEAFKQLAGAGGDADK